MYYVNREQINLRLQFMDTLAEGFKELNAGSLPPLAARMAEERMLHLAAEAVTDIGSLMIDAFIMRDASSYEDIVDILHGEGVFADGLHAGLRRLVLLRKPLVQEYYVSHRTSYESWLGQTAELLESFKQSITEYLQQHT